MARARNIKPALFKNELLGVEDPMLTLLFVGLWSLADRDGKLEDRPLRIKAEIFPYREGTDINRYLTDLYTLGFIQRYTVDGAPIIKVCKFLEHQRPHKTEKDSVLPDPPENIEESDSCPLTVKGALNNEENASKNALIPDSLVLIPDPCFLKEDSPDNKKKPAAEKPKPKKLCEKYKAPADVTKQQWQDYLEARKFKKRTMTEGALELFVVAFDRTREATGLDPKSLIEMATIGGWQTIKPDFVTGQAGRSEDGRDTGGRHKTREQTENFAASVVDALEKKHGASFGDGKIIDGEVVGATPDHAQITQEQW